MKNSLSTATLSLAALFLAAGCMESPLLDHVNASGTPDLERQVTAKCPLEFTTKGLCGSITWTKQQTEDESGEFTLRFWSSAEGTENGPFVSPAERVDAKLWMPSMGHGAGPIQVRPAKDSTGEIIPGVFEATNVYFTMNGDWEIWVHLKSGSTTLDRAKVDVTL